MSAGGEELPPSVRQQVARFQQLQQTLNAIELQKSPDDVVVYKAVGPVLVQTSKQKLLEELGEKRELTETRLRLLEKQEQRAREQLEDLQKELKQVLSGKGVG